MLASRRPAAPCRRRDDGSELMFDAVTGFLQFLIDSMSGGIPT
jgi:hypothetical protein